MMRAYTAQTWLWLPYPSITPPFDGIIQTGDGKNLIVWKNGSPGRWQVFTMASRSWSPIGNLPPGAVPSTFSHVSRRRVLMMDTNDYSLYSLGVPGSGLAYKHNVINFYQVITSPNPPYISGGGYNLQANGKFRLGYITEFPDVAHIIYIDPNPGTGLIVQFQIDKMIPTAAIFTNGMAQLVTQGCINGSVPYQTGYQPAAQSYYPGCVFCPKLDGSLVQDYYDGMDQNLYGPNFQGYMLTNPPLATVYTQQSRDWPPPQTLTNYRRVLLQISVSSSAVMGTKIFASPIIGGGGVKLAGVYYQPFDWPRETFFAGGRIATPSTFTSSNWSMHILDNTVCILDDNWNFWSLALWQYDMVFQTLTNFCRVNRGML